MDLTKSEWPVALRASLPSSAPLSLLPLEPRTGGKNTLLQLSVGPLSRPAPCPASPRPACGLGETLVENCEWKLRANFISSGGLPPALPPSTPRSLPAPALRGWREAAGEVAVGAVTDAAEPPFLVNGHENSLSMPVPPSPHPAPPSLVATPHARGCGKASAPPPTSPRPPTSTETLRVGVRNSCCREPAPAGGGVLWPRPPKAPAVACPWAPARRALMHRSSTDTSPSSLTDVWQAGGAACGRGPSLRRARVAVGADTWWFSRCTQLQAVTTLRCHQQAQRMRG
jgi:hypothetical protein